MKIFFYLFFAVLQISADSIPYDFGIRFFPIDMNKDWFIRTGLHTTLHENSSWKKIPELPLSDKLGDLKLESVE